MGPFAMPLLLEEKIQAISSWIEETARHTTTPLRSRDSDLFLDLDLAVLGRSPHGEFAAPLLHLCRAYDAPSCLTRVV